MRYLSRLVGVNVALALLGLAGLMQLVDLLDSSGTLLAAGEGIGGMATYALWRLPTIAEQVLPISVLAGTLVTLFVLVRRNEIVAMRTMGVTSYRVLLCLVPVALAGAAIHFGLDDRVNPWTEPRFAAWWQDVEARAKPTDRDRPHVWMRIGDTVVSVGHMDADRRSLGDVSFIMLDAGGAITRRLDARSAAYVADAWQLRDVRDIRIDGVSVTAAREPIAPWPDAAPAEAVLGAVMPQQSLSSGQLLTILRGEAPATSSESHYLTLVHRKLSLLTTVPLMILLAMPAAFGSPRFGGAGRGLLLGGLLGAGSLVVDGILSALGGIGLVPPFLAAWSAPLIFASIGAAVLLKLEEP